MGRINNPQPQREDGNRIPVCHQDDCQPDWLFEK